jgi:hypothetical protein
VHHLRVDPLRGRAVGLENFLGIVEIELRVRAQELQEGIEVTVEVDLSRGDRSVSVSAADADITRASVVAMVDGLDRLLAVAAEDGAEPDAVSVADD